MNRQNILKTAIMLTATLLIAACTNDEMADSQPETLPEGMYPLTFTATQADIVASPQTRVTDFDKAGVHKSKWTTGDQIEVIVEGGGNNMETTCTLNENGQITQYDPQVYWKTNQKSTINAWYSNITDHSTVTSNTVSLDDQSNGLAYVLKADEMINVNYKSGNIPLQFKHQLAKVRVKLEKRIYEGNLDGATVKMKGCYTSCIVSNGTVAADITTGDITMYKTTSGSDTYYEANVVPGTALKDIAFEISADGKTTTANLTSEITLTKGNVHSITLAIDNKKLTEITGGGTIDSPGDYIMTGTITETVTLNANDINLILKDVNVDITGKDRPAIEITGGSTVITVVGNNVLSSTQWGGITMSNNANLTIKSADKNSNSLTVTAGHNESHKASTVGIGAIQNGVCGDIFISNVNLTVSGDNSFVCGGAAIGTSSISSACGNITITNAIINATSGRGAAAIGLGCTATVQPEPNEILKVSDIRITSSEITVILNPYYSSIPENSAYGAGIGMSVIWYGNFKCGTIIIDKKESELEDFSRNWKLNDSFLTKHNYKIGKGYEHDGAKPQDIKFGGVELNDKILSDGWGKWSVP